MTVPQGKGGASAPPTLPTVDESLAELESLAERVRDSLEQLAMLELVADAVPVTVMTVANELATTQAVLAKLVRVVVQRIKADQR